MTVARQRRVDSDNPEITDLVDAVAEREQREARRPIRPWGEPTIVKTKNYPAKSNELIVVDPTFGALTIYLPIIRRDFLGEGMAIVNASASTNTITVQPNSDATIDGAATVTITSAWGTIKLLAVTTTKWVTV